jgi:IS5 family transposase
VRLWHDLLAPAQGVASGRRLEATVSCLARSSRSRRADRLVESFRGRGQRARPRGGTQTGPNPTDRGKSGTKRHLVVDRNGIPLAIDLTGANLNETTFLEEIVEEIEPIRTPRGGRRKRPDKLHADKGFDSKANREALRERGITPRIARKGIESSEKLGRYRWVVERTLSWLNR